MSKANTEELESLHASLTEDLTDTLKSGKATTADKNLIRQFLKDNDVVAVVENNKPIQSLIGVLPSFEEENDPELKH